MKSLIGNPLRAASEAEMMPASATAKFLQEQTDVKMNTKKSAKESENTQWPPRGGRYIYVTLPFPQ